MDNKSLIAAGQPARRQPICTRTSSGVQTLDDVTSTANKCESENQDQSLSGKEGRRKRRGSKKKSPKTIQEGKGKGKHGNTPSSIKPSAQAANCKPEGKGCRSMASESNNQNKTQKKQSEPCKVKEQRKSAQQQQQQLMQPQSQKPTKQQQQSNQQQPKQKVQQQQHSQVIQGSVRGKNKSAATNGQAKEASKVEAVPGSRNHPKGPSPVRKYSPEQLLAALTSLDMNNNSKAAQPTGQLADRKIIFLSNQSQYEIKAQILCEAIPFRLPKSNA